MSKKIRNLFLMLALVLVTAFAVLLGTGTNVKAEKFDVSSDAGAWKASDDLATLLSSDGIFQLNADGKFVLVSDATINVNVTEPFYVNEQVCLNFTGSDAILNLCGNELIFTKGLKLQSGKLIIGSVWGTGIIDNVTVDGGELIIDSSADGSNIHILNLTIKSGTVTVRPGAKVHANVTKTGGTLSIDNAADFTWVARNTAELQTAFAYGTSVDDKTICIDSDVTLDSDLTTVGNITLRFTESALYANQKTITVNGTLTMNWANNDIGGKLVINSGAKVRNNDDTLATGKFGNVTYNVTSAGDLAAALADANADVINLENEIDADVTISNKVEIKGAKLNGTVTLLCSDATLGVEIKTLNVETTYVEIKKAVETVNVNSDATIKGDISGDVVVAEGVTVIIEDDITGSLKVNDGCIVSVNGSVGDGVIVDEGTVTVDVTGAVTGDVTVNGGEVTIDDDVTGNVTVNGGKVTIGGAVNNGDVIVNGGEVTIAGDVNGDVSVNGGKVTIDGDVKGCVTLNRGELTIKGTIFGKDGKAIIYSDGKLNSDGTLNAKVDESTTHEHDLVTIHSDGSLCWNENGAFAIPYFGNGKVGNFVPVTIIGSDSTLTLVYGEIFDKDGNLYIGFNARANAPLFTYHANEFLDLEDALDEQKTAMPEYKAATDSEKLQMKISAYTLKNHELAGYLKFRDAFNAVRAGLNTPIYLYADGINEIVPVSLKDDEVSFDITVVYNGKSADITWQFGEGTPYNYMLSDTTETVGDETKIVSTTYTFYQLLVKYEAYLINGESMGTSATTTKAYGYDKINRETMTIKLDGEITFDKSNLYKFIECQNSTGTAVATTVAYTAFFDADGKVQSVTIRSIYNPFAAIVYEAYNTETEEEKVVGRYETFEEAFKYVGEMGKIELYPHYEMIGEAWTLVTELSGWQYIAKSTLETFYVQKFGGVTFKNLTVTGATGTAEGDMTETRFMVNTLNANKMMFSRKEHKSNIKFVIALEGYTGADKEQVNKGISWGVSLKDVKVPSAAVVGFTFQYWTKSLADTEPARFVFANEEMPTSNLTLYAVYTLNAPSFDQNNYTGKYDFEEHTVKVSHAAAKGLVALTLDDDVEDDVAAIDIDNGGEFKFGTVGTKTYTLTATAKNGEVELTAYATYDVEINPLTFNDIGWDGWKEDGDYDWGKVTYLNLSKEYDTQPIDALTYDKNFSLNLYVGDKPYKVPAAAVTIATDNANKTNAGEYWFQVTVNDANLSGSFYVKYTITRKAIDIAVDTSASMVWNNSVNFVAAGYKAYENGTTTVLSDAFMNELKSTSAISYEYYVDEACKTKYTTLGNPDTEVTVYAKAVNGNANYVINDQTGSIKVTHAVAKVTKNDSSTTYVGSLKDAFTTTTTKVELLSNVELSSPITVPGIAVTVDLNNKKVSAKDSGCSALFVTNSDDAKLTVKNGTLVNNFKNVIEATNGGELELDNVTITAKSGYAVKTNSTKVTIKNTNEVIEAKYVLDLKSLADNSLIDGGCYKGTLTITGDTAVIKSGKFDKAPKPAYLASAEVAVMSNEDDDKGTYTFVVGVPVAKVSDKSFDSVKSAVNYITKSGSSVSTSEVVVLRAHADENIVLVPGVYDFKITAAEAAYLANVTVTMTKSADYTMKADTTNPNAYIYKSKMNLFGVGSDGFATFEEAVEKAITVSDPTIVLKGNLRVFTFEIDKTIKLDLNGKTLEDCTLIVENEGNLTIVGKGEMQNCDITNEGIMTIYADVEVTGDYAVLNNGKMTIGSDATLTPKFDVELLSNSALVINNGEFASVTIMESDATINGGTFKSFTVEDAAKVYLTAGVFTLFNADLDEEVVFTVEKIGDYYHILVEGGTEGEYGFMAKIGNEFAVEGATSVASGKYIKLSAGTDLITGRVYVKRDDEYAWFGKDFAMTNKTLGDVVDKID